MCVYIYIYIFTCIWISTCIYIYIYLCVSLLWKVFCKHKRCVLSTCRGETAAFLYANQETSSSMRRSPLSPRTEIEPVFCSVQLSYALVLLVILICSGSLAASHVWKRLSYCLRSIEEPDFVSIYRSFRILHMLASSSGKKWPSYVLFAGTGEKNSTCIYAQMMKLLSFTIGAHRDLHRGGEEKEGLDFLVRVLWTKQVNERRYKVNRTRCIGDVMDGKRDIYRNISELHSYL